MMILMAPLQADMNLSKITTEILDLLDARKWSWINRKNCIKTRNSKKQITTQGKVANEREIFDNLQKKDEKLKDGKIFKINKSLTYIYSD